MNMKKYLLVILFHMAVFSLFAQKQKISVEGSINDKHTLESLEFATVAVIDTKSKAVVEGTLSDEQGNFKLVCEAVDTVFIRVQYVGYHTLDTIFQLSEGKHDLSLLLGLKPALESLKEVVVSAGKNAVSTKMDRQSFNVQQLGNTSGGTGLDVLQRLPSVTINAEGKILMRGNAEFVVTVNGKFTNLEAADVLAQIPANTIESIEILSSPSASYDSEGKAGIINIITKKNVDQGLSVIVNGNLSSINPERYGSDITLNHGAGRLQSFFSANYRRYDIGGYRLGEIRTLHRDTITYSPSGGDRPLRETVYGIRGGATFTANKRNVFSSGVYYGYKRNDRTAKLDYAQFATTQNLNDLYQSFDSSALESVFYNENLFVRTGRFFTLNSDYVHTFLNKSRLSLLAIYEHSVLGGPLANRNEDLATGELLLKERSDERSPLNAWRFQADYGLPLSANLNMETGLQWRTVQHDGYFTFERLNIPQNTWEGDPEFNDELHLRQDVFAVYAQLNGQFKKLSYRGGIRGEYTDRYLTHLLGNAPFELQQFDWFPTLQALLKISDSRELKLGYSKRIDRPTTKALSPFKNHRHSEAIWIGDPSLLPEISHNVELGYVHRFEKMVLSFTAYHRYTKNLVFRVNDDYNRITLFVISTNAGNSNASGLEFIADWQPVKWGRFYLSGNTYHFRIDNIKNAEVQATESLNYNLNGNMSFQLGKKWRLQYDASYLSRTVTAQGRDTDLLLSNVSLRYRHSDRLSFDLLAQNIFDSNTQRITTQSPTFYSSTAYTKSDRILQLSASYRFNDTGKTVKGAKTEYGERDF